MLKAIRTPMLRGACFALAVAPVLFGQNPEEARKTILREKVAAEKMMNEMATVESARTMTFDFVAGEAVGGRTVKGAPYSAEAVTETVQTLGDGNRIVNRSSATLYRDSEGRERREQVLDNIGGMTAASPVKTVSIWDPVAKVNYSLSEEMRTARKSGGNVFTVTRDGITENIVTDAAGGVMTHNIRGPEGPMIMRSTMPRVAAGEGQVMIYESQTIARSSTGGGNDPRNKTEDLGERMVEGVKARGSRFTRTIPRGEIGNERPIEVISERWYSDELKTVVMTKRTDPRMGDTTYKLVNVNRSEPQRTLFEVPADYTLIDNGPRVMMRSAPAAAKERKPEELF